MDVPTVLWILALTFTVTGLVCVLRYQITIGAILLRAGRALGLYAGSLT